MLDLSQRQILLTLARQSILAGLREQRCTSCADFNRDDVLTAPHASFVTLRRQGALRGCCGTLEPQGTLAEGVWRNAWSSAFSDPRFARLQAAEYPDLDVHISILSPLEPLPVLTAEELLQTIRPGIDGLLLRTASAQATFLPAVWEQLPQPQEFLRQLKAKAGWPADFWSGDLRAWRYTTESFGEP